MFVGKLIMFAHNDEYISVEDEDFNVIAEGKTMDVLANASIYGLFVRYFYTGIRNNNHCTVIIVRK